MLPEEIAKAFVRWHEAGRITGAGSATLKALRDLSAGGHWALCGASGEFAAGTGAVMRIAPLGFLLDPEEDADRRTIRDVARITHRNDEAYAGAIAVVAAIRSRLRPGSADDLLATAAAVAPDSATRDRILELAPLRDSTVAIAARFGSSGHVVDAVPLALYIARFHTGSPLETVLAEAAGLGGDTDTIAAIAGQVVGAGLEPGALPWHLLQKLPELSEVEAVIGAFTECASLKRSG